MLIKWEPIIEHHCLGRCELGDIWIRLDKENKVTGMYPMWLKTKIIPTTKEEETLDGIKIVAELL